MNIVSTIVGLSVAATATPAMLQMSIAPLEAQKRANNLGIAESTAVTFAAQNEGAVSAGTAPSGCTLTPGGSGDYEITCTEGQGSYVQTVSRSFRLAIEDNDTGGSRRTFPYARPAQISGAHQCPPNDEWGLNWWNDTYEAAVGACMPQVAWSQTSYVLSDPDDWLYDINNINGWGHHSQYDDVAESPSCDDNDGNNGHGNNVGGYDCSNPGKSNGSKGNTSK
jgi:hypothetical protein